MRNRLQLPGWKARAGLVAALALVLTAAFAAQQARPAGARQAANDTIVIAIPGTPQGVDLDREAGPQSWTIAGQVLELGMEWKRVAYPFPVHGGINNSKIPGFTYPALLQQQTVPGLITKCTLENGGRTAILQLRKGVRSGHGNEFTTADIMWRVQRANANKAIGVFMTTSANAPNPSQWHPLGKYTMRVTASSPMPLMCLINTNEYWTYPDSTDAKKHATKADPWANNYMPFYGGGFGPYYITKWVPGQEVDLEANKYYWKGAPAIKHIIYKVVPESSNRVALLQSGAVQMTEGLSPEDVISLSKKKGVNVAAVRSNLSIYLVMNNTQAPFNNVKVRQAINYAIPRSDIVKSVYRGLAEEWQGVYPSLYPGYIKYNTYATNVDKAKQLLKQAGYSKGFKTIMTYNAGDPVQGNLAVVLQSALKKIGITATIQQQPPGPYSDLIQSKKGTFGLWLDFPIQPDPNYSMRLFYLTGNAVNYQNYHNPQVDGILDKCVGTIGAARIKCNQQAEPIIERDAPLGWIAEPNYLIGLSSKLAGWGWYTTQYYHVADLHYTK